MIAIKRKNGFSSGLSFRARVFMALVGISAVTSLVIGLVLYYFAGNRLVEIERDLLAQRSSTANAGAEDFLEGLRNPRDRTLPEPDTYAEELVQQVAQSTGLGVLYVGPNGEPLAARNGLGDALPPEEAYDRTGLTEETVDRVLRSSSGGRLIPRSGPLRYIAVWPLAGSDGTSQGVMVYNSPQDELDQTLAFLRYGILGAIGTSILLAAAGSLLLSREITRPLSKTRDAAIRVASGDYTPVPVEREDELGEVARAFNYMAGEVEHYVGEIQEQKSRLEAVLESTPEAVVATDSEERVTMANPAAARMLGVYTNDYGRPLADIGIPHQILRCVREASAKGTAVREVEQDDNSYWTYAAQMNRDDSPDTQNTGIILAVRDISEHRALERAKTAFVSDVSHELRTPLTTIQSAVDLMERAREKLDPLEHRALELADQELKRIRAMVEELLVLAQMDSWQYSLEAAPTNLDSVIQSSLDSLQSKAERFGIEFHFDANGIEHQCMCDSQKLYQVFLNLLDNAIKYSDPGGRVDVSIDEDESFMTVRIKDTGVGIPEEDLPQLFERFYRVNKDRSRATGGSGLGLSIAKEIVAMHGGDISVESQVGVGSTFSIRLPKSTNSRSANHAS
ncbi:MAG TPA: ATP-binding protein [Rubrobacteraceae bacterium]|nr:ATP-binding protein [Rubrobacteraceae bacterium]